MNAYLIVGLVIAGVYLGLGVLILGIGLMMGGVKEYSRLKKESRKISSTPLDVVATWDPIHAMHVDSDRRRYERQAAEIAFSMIVGLVSLVGGAFVLFVVVYRLVTS